MQGGDLDRPLLIVCGLCRFVRLAERYANDLSHDISRLFLRQEFPSVLEEPDKLEERDKHAAVAFAPGFDRAP